MKMSQWISKVRLYMEIVKWGTHLKLRIKMRKIQNSIYHKKWCETTSKITSELFTTSPNAGRWSLAVTAIVLLGRYLLVAEYIFFSFLRVWCPYHHVSPCFHLFGDMLGLT
jgi:hypothetical protein